ncbi:TAXI family TRAP transporter solute-binding subunit [Methylobacterium sp. J-070]|uniref:TAXI family TRAP transporter solute-binding subunit n=1 Tax=Methylobacterium sp. J-070 TaxID=2836650 RepID=UPI001FB8CC4C|nr:TAXI family TRAP transporter solute-binding subunit [Methylobacterium sp. J-070]MCJ2051701.1 TRAP transporter substrate-binding protein [Methylobacterium sp. J-070]
MRAPLAALAFVLATSSSVLAAEPPTFRLCTGSESGNYFRAGHMLKSKAGSLKIEVVPTPGSLDNLDKLSAGQCDGAFVQSDALLVYSSKNAQALSTIERAGVLYQEQVHLLCNRSAGVAKITDLGKANTVAVGPDGSGGRTTWDAFALADKKRFGSVGVDTRAGVRALSAVADGSQVQCALWVGALNASFIKNDAQAQGDRVVLVRSDDHEMVGSAKDARGQPVYGYGEIPAGTYPRIQPGGLVFGTKALDTIAVDALFVTAIPWVNANERAYDGLLRAFTAAKPQIQAIAQPQD